MAKKTNDAPDGLDYLGTPGRTVYQRWKNILEKKQIWDDDCIEIVGMAAMQYEIYIKASQELLKPSIFGEDWIDNSFVVQHKNGSTGMSPWVTIQNTAFNSVNKFIIKFGLTPVDRTKASKREDDEEDEI